MHHFLTQALGGCDQIICNSKVKLVSCCKTRVSCKNHHILFTHAVSKPRSYGCPSGIMDSPFFDASFRKYLIKLSSMKLWSFTSCFIITFLVLEIAHTIQSGLYKNLTKSASIIFQHLIVFLSTPILLFWEYNRFVLKKSALFFKMLLSSVL